MKKIGIYLERKPDSGGAYQYCLAMLKALSEKNHKDFDVYAFYTYEKWENIVKPLQIESFCVQKNKLQKVIYYLSEKILSVEFYRNHMQWLHPLSQKCKELSIDACIFPCGDKVSFMVNVPAVVTVFDLMHRYLKEFPEIVEEKIYRSRERSYTYIASYANIILVDSLVGKEQFIECYGSNNKMRERLEKITQILPYIAPDYVYNALEKEKIKSPVPFKKYIFYPAQFWKHKNHKNLLLAIAKLKEKGIIVSLVLCGSGKNSYEEIIEIIGKFCLEQQILVLGYVSNHEMTALYQNARALVMPTYGGPTNIPQLEAFVLGCPVATSNIFGIPEQVGDAAVLFDPNNVDEMADVIERLWNDDEWCDILIDKGYKKALAYGEHQYQEKLFGYLDKFLNIRKEE